MKYKEIVEQLRGMPDWTTKRVCGIEVQADRRFYSLRGRVFVTAEDAASYLLRVAEDEK